MKKYAQIVFILFIVITGCMKDVTLTSKDYPFLLTTEVTGIDNTGATFNATFLDKGKDTIKEYGFVYDITKLSEEEKGFIKNTSDLTSNKYNHRISSDLTEGQVYYVRAYAKSGSFLIFGNEVFFTSSGSLSPVISTFFPESGTDGTIFKISGQNFSVRKDNNKVKIGTKTCEVISSTNTEIVCRSPLADYFGKFKIEVEVSGKTARSEADFNIIGPQISSIEPQDAEPGVPVTITGEHLTDKVSPATVFFNDYQADIISSDSNKIIVRVPPYTINFNTVTIKTGFKTLTHPYKVKISQTYRKLATADFTNTYLFSTFSTSKRGYVFAYDKIWQYDPVMDNWSVECQFPGQTRYNSIAFTIDNKAYIGGGSNFSGTNIFEFWEYTIDSGTWKQLSDIPIITYPHRGFALNNNGYVLGESSVWRYNPGDDTWIQKKDFPSYNHEIITFVAENKAYAKISSTRANFYTYSETTDEWIQKADCPLEKAGYTISINNKGYIGYYYGELYEYKPEYNVWITKIAYPGCQSCTYNYAFSVNNIGYIGNISSCNGDCNSSFYSFIP